MPKYAFEIWDIGTGNMIDAFDTESEALDAVRDALERHGHAYVESWALAYATTRQVRSLGEGRGLIERALAVEKSRTAGIPAAD